MVSVKRTYDLLCTLLICIIFLISFRSLAAFLSPSLGSDNAVHVLMAYHLKLPDDLYYWGQDRLGSIVPILSHFLLKIISVPPVQAVSWVQYFLLLIGFLCFAGLFRRGISRVIFAIVWFLPLEPFIALIRIGQPYAAQIAFLGISLVLFNRLIESDRLRPQVRQLFISMAVASLFISLWTSDFSIVTILLLAGRGLQYLYQKFLDKTISLKASIVDIANVVIISLLGCLFILYAKVQANAGRDYSTFNSFAQILAVIQRLTNSIVRTLTFRAEDSFLSVHAVLVVVLLIYFTYLAIARRSIIDLNQSRWFFLFLSNAVVGFVLLILSSWVYRNGVNLRYFTIIYILLWLTALCFTEALQGNSAKGAYTLLILIALSSSLSLPNYVFALEKPESKIQNLRGIQSLGQAGFIGDYWASYILCSVDPARLDCTPYDRKGMTPCPDNPAEEQQVGNVRCPRCIPEVLASETIYLVKNKWFDAFPDQTQQFRQCLVKVGEPRRVSGYTIAPYRKQSANSS